MIDPNTGQPVMSGNPKYGEVPGFSYTAGKDLNFYDAIGSMYDGTSYESAARSNPYLVDTYGDKDIWDRIGDWLDFKTSEDFYQRDRANNALAYSSQLANQKREEDYNAAPAQVDRERKAGINPDLAGGVSPGEAAENTEFPGIPTEGGNPDPLKLVGNCLNFGLQLMGGLQDVEGKVLTNEGVAVSNFDKMQTQAFIQMYSAMSGLTPNEFFSANPLDFSKNPYREGSRKAKRYDQAASIVGSDFSRFGNRYFEDRNKLISGMLDFGEKSAHPAVSTNPATGMPDDLSAVIGAFRDFAKDAFEARKGKAKDDYQYQSSFSGQLAGEAENAQNNLAKDEKTMQDELREPLKNLVSSLSTIANDPKQKGFERLLANACLIFLYWVQMQ